MNTISSFFKKYKKTSIAAVIIIIVGIWYYHSTHIAVATTYTVKPASIGTIKTTVSGTGQVSSSQQLTIYPQVSGTVLTVNVKNGDTVTKGQVLATLDNTNAYYSLKNAQIALQKLQTLNPISNTNDENTTLNAQNSLTQAYQSAFNNITSAYNDMGPIVTGLNDIFYNKNTSPYFTDTNVGSTYGTPAQQYKQTAGALLDKATAEYNAFRQAYLGISVSSTTSIDTSLSQEITLAQDLADATKSAAVAINYIIAQTPQGSRTSPMTTDHNNVSTWLSTTNGDSSSLTSALTGIQSSQQSLGQAQANLSANQTTNSPLDLQSAELSLEQAQTTYNNYTVRAPFDGVIGNVTLQPGDTAGGSTGIGTIVTKNYVSTIVLNEIDVAKVTIGQPVNITFNALPNIIATGTIIDVDSVGTVSQGVVSYNVKISINTDDPQVKAGMSINADIVTAEEDNVVIVPNAAIKTQGGRSYVQVPASTVTPSASSLSYSGSTTGSRRYNAYASSTASTSRYFNASSTPRTGRASTTPSTFSQNVGATSTGSGGTVTSVTSKAVQVGLSDNANTEIISGLNAGDLVVTQTLTGTAAKTTASTNILSSLSGGGARAGGAGFTGGARPTGR